MDSVDSWEMILTSRCRVATNVLDYVTAIKVSDASMKCSTHAETAVVEIASNVYEQLPLRVTYRTTRITPRNKRHESLCDRDTSWLIHCFIKTSHYQSRFAGKISTNEAIRTFQTLPWDEASLREWLPFNRKSSFATILRFFNVIDLYIKIQWGIKDKKQSC